MIDIDIEPLSQKGKTSTEVSPLQGRRAADLGIADYIMQLASLKEKIIVLESELSHLSRDIISNKIVVKEIQEAQVELKLEIKQIKQQNQTAETLLSGLAKNLGDHMKEETDNKNRLLFWIISTLLTVIGSVATMVANKLI